MPEDKILIVEDEDLMRSILEKLIAGEGYGALTAADGVEGLDVYRRERPDLVLSDIRMPGMDGLALLEEIRKLDEEAMVVMITAFGSVDSAVEAMHRGAYDYITKPFMNNDIRVKVARALEMKRTRRDLRETRALMAHSEKLAALGQLAAGIVHEINTPIGAIRSHVDLLDRLWERLKASGAEGSILQDIETVEKLNRTSREACGRIAGLAKSLRRFAHLDEAKRKRANLHESIDSVLGLLQHELEGRIGVVKAYGQIPDIVCYPSELNQVFLHLLLNAIEAIDSEGEIRIETRREDGRVVVEIGDTGRGIPEAVLDRVFDPRFTIKGARVRLGIGLAICYRIVEEHGGTIQITSEEDRGTRVRMSLPIE